MLKHVLSDNQIDRLRSQRQMTRIATDLQVPGILPQHLQADVQREHTALSDTPIQESFQVHVPRPQVQYESALSGEALGEGAEPIDIPEHGAGKEPRVQPPVHFSDSAEHVYRPWSHHFGDTGVGKCQGRVLDICLLDDGWKGSAKLGTMLTTLAG